MWPATPSSNSKRENRRTAAASIRLRCRRSSAALANLGGWGTFGALAGEPAISSSGRWEVETGSLLRLGPKCDAPLGLTPAAISFESTGTATAGGKVLRIPEGHYMVQAMALGLPNIILPRRMVKATREKALTSWAGSAERTTRSASIPLAMRPECAEKP